MSEVKKMAIEADYIRRVKRDNSLKFRIIRIFTGLYYRESGIVSKFGFVVSRILGVGWCR